MENINEAFRFTTRIPTPSIPVREAHVSVRLLWPFARPLRSSESLLESLRRIGINAAEFASPSTRLPHRTMLRLLQEAVDCACDPALGLRAGDLSEPGDFEALEYAARSCETLGDALACLSRYMRLLHDAAELRITDEGEQVAVRFRTTDGIPQPTPAADFVMAALAAFLRRNLSIGSPMLEVWFEHDRPGHVSEYARVFAVPVRFNAPSNALILPKALLSAPMLRADSLLASAFQLRADRLLSQLKEHDGVTGRVREVVMRGDLGDLTMEWTACRLGMSVATLRRRLEAEGTTFSEIVDSVRRSYAEQHLTGGAATISEVAFLLGFSSAGAFHKAFKRWTGVAPTAYRLKKRSTPPPAMPPLHEPESLHAES